MKKLCLSIFFIFVLTLIPTHSNATSSIRTSVFSDLSIANYYYEVLYSLHLKEVIEGEIDENGHILISPNLEVTRAEAAYMLYQLLGMSPGNETHYSDVKSSDWYADAVSAISERQIMIGYPDGSFKPNDPLTRAHMAKIITKSFGYNIPTTISNNFTDVNETYKGFVEALYANGITTGVTTTKYEPNLYIPRKQMAAFLMRAYDNVPGNEFNDYEVMNTINESIRKVRNLLIQGLENSYPNQNEEVIKKDLQLLATNPYYSRAVEGYIASCYFCDGANVPRDLDFGLLFNLKNLSATSIILESASPRSEFHYGVRTTVELIKNENNWKIRNINSQSLTNIPLSMNIADALDYIPYRLAVDYKITTNTIRHIGKESKTGHELFKVNEEHIIGFDIRDGYLVIQ
ncbi:S-layer homology domain-containing protein [Paenisporosarcina quisquiliarum]|uniref:S-layer homology domain-containing protein n=1 Tax=Paenisporosarcina quisquiliarum TaxID=365346 RepID=UPI003736EEF5